ncbi:DUF3349 domain-containing protein [Cumulibacter manganitolerans]|uniref:DUF3349 domain-containing protein n=1 Tax=Cumulibacter manganitolerans TaxID=1884992 RepID=UPI001E2FB4FA|nr:DUF3349 domain-containing protein [Cumulibacter manganitolerans]
MADNLLTRILGWLRAGYPNGVPRGDYVALLGILHRQLTTTELDQIVDALGRYAEQGKAAIGREDIERVISERTFQNASADDIARVSARLAAGGWPLAGSAAMHRQAEQPDADADAKDGLLTRVTAWLKKGYPAGVPQQDYIPLIALLRRRLSDDDVRDVVELLVADGTIPADRTDIGAAIVRVTDEMPSEPDLRRVREQLGDSELDVPQ